MKSIDAWARVRGQIESSLCDWPGRICSVLFLGGCNFKCPTCHNADMAWAWEGLPRYPRAQVLGDLQRRRKWLDGITITGGEPTCTPELAGLLADLGATGLPIKLDSNGSSPETLRTLLQGGLVHTVAVDIKGPWALYPVLTGQCMSPGEARAALTAVFGISKEFPGRVYFRCTKVPLLTPEDLAVTEAQIPTGETLIFQEFVPPQKG